MKENCTISPDWEGVIEGGFQQSSSWVSLFEIARKLEVRNLKIEIHTGAFIMGYYSRADEEVMEITSQVVVHYKSLRVKCNGFSTSGKKK